MASPPDTLTGFGVDHPPLRGDGHALHPGPVSVRFEPAELLRGIRQWFLAHTFSSLLAGPGSSDSADPSRTLSGLLPTFPAFPRAGLPSASPDSCDCPAAGSFHPCSISVRSVRGALPVLPPVGFPEPPPEPGVHR